MASPLEIEIILHYHSSNVIHPRQYAPAVKEAINSLLNKNMMKSFYFSGDVRYRTTGKGDMFVKMLCETPFPVTKYVDPRIG